MMGTNLTGDCSRRQRNLCVLCDLCVLCGEKQLTAEDAEVAEEG